MIIEKVSYTEYDRISRKNEYYLWHFLMREQGPLAFKSLFDNKDEINHLTYFFEYIKLPYFESYTDESIDFLDKIGISQSLLWGKRTFRPVIVGFKGKRMISNTFETCYCTGGLVEVIAKMDVKLLDNFNFD